jgi:hypothetical protein
MQLYKYTDFGISWDFPYKFPKILILIKYKVNDSDHISIQFIGRTLMDPLKFNYYHWILLNRNE